ncbi:ATP-binding protein [Ideonella sp.]|uniref:sensor histidine kinase n=1 Tax=Ideonella sp. TaxID=1929293 RepID=UPI0035B4ED9E
MSRSTPSDAHPAPDLARRLLDALPPMVAYWDSDQRCRFANQAYKTWFGADPDRMLGMHISELLGPRLYALNRPYIERALAGQRQDFERAIPGPDGRVRHSLATYLPDVVGGQVEGFMVHVSEVTPLKEAQAALSGQADQALRAHRALQEAQRLGGIGSWEYDAVSGVSVWSDELCRIYGLPAGTRPPPLGQRAHMFTPDSARRLQEVVAHSMASGEPYTIELEIIQSSGEHRWIEGRGEVVRANDGHVTGLRGTALDITWRRQTEQARLQLAVAEAASRNKSQLLSRVSHELRTPLNAILGFTELCRRQAGDQAPLADWLLHIANAGQHMLRLVDEILDTAAAEAGRLPLALEAVRLQDVLPDSLAGVGPQAQAAGLHVQAPASQALALRVRADRRRLRQVIDNLLSNAVKYTPRGGRVDLDAQATGDEVVLRVCDTGPGLDEAQMQQLFERFSRLGAQRLGVPGTGLGLALSRTLAEAMGGRLDAHSRPGEGCVFELRLPAASGDAA